jgi:AraC-like DNA-binding protein
MPFRSAATTLGGRRIEPAHSTQKLHPAAASASNVAKKLGISTRTLSRKLRDERVAFPEILEETRVALAKRYLVERDLPVSEIAWLLGYGEISSFTHAFKRWTGMTPREFRLTPASLYPANALPR